MGGRQQDAGRVVEAATWPGLLSTQQLALEPQVSPDPPNIPA